MKKIIIILLSVFAVIYLGLTIIDTSEYRVEKKLWRMQKKFSAIAQDPKSVPENQFEQVVERYRKLIKRYPKSRYVPQMYSRIGSVYLMNRKYEEARKSFGEVVAKFKDDPKVVALAMMDIGNSYLAENKISEAVNVFQRTADGYSHTETGFMMPLYIAGVYRSVNQPEKMGHYLGLAEKFYKSIADNVQESDEMRINSYQALSTTYIAQKEWNKALDVLKKSLYDFADSTAMRPQRLSVITRSLNVVCIAQLNDYVRAEKIYRDFIQDHPGHYLNSFLEKVLESLAFLKENQLKAVAP